MQYLLGNLSLGLDCIEAQTSDRLIPLWQSLFHGRSLTSAVPEQAGCLRFGAAAPPCPNLRQRVRESGGLSVWRTPEGYHLACGASAVTMDTLRGQATGYLAPDFWRQPLAWQREFLLLTVVILLRWRNGYGLHANAVAWDEDGVLIVGSSGSGKTTLTLGLVQAGGRCLGDDVLVLQQVDGAVAAHALRRGFACTTLTAGHFPALAEALATAPALSERKKLLALETLWPERFTLRCRPRLIVFPAISGAPHSRLVPLNPSQTLCALLEQSLGILADTAVARQQLAVLGQLAQQARGYRLQAGRDVYAEPERIAASLRAAMTEKG